MRQNLVSCLGLLLLVVGCNTSDALSPSSLPLDYNLTQTNSNALPLVFWVDGPITYSLIGESLTLGEGGHGTRTQTTTSANTATNHVTTKTISFGFDYRVNGGKIELGSFRACPPDAICAANDTGTIDGDGITLTANSYGRPDLLLIYKVAAH